MAGPCTSGFWRWMVLMLMATTASGTGQVCPIEGYVRFRGVCYKAFTELKTYDEAKQTCDSDGGLLAMPKDSATNALFHNLVGDMNRWIGLTDDDSEGQWIFEDGQTLASTGYTNWAPGEPNNVDGGEHCVEMYTTGQWNDDQCTRTKGFICQVAMACPIAGYDNFNGVCYKDFPELKNYTQASQTCAADGGLLAMPKDDTINTFIHNQLAGDNVRWIGLTDDDGEGQWIFADGQTLESTGYTNWAPGEPNNVDGGEHCVEMYTNGRWNDERCNRTKGLICQVPLVQWLEVFSTVNGTGQTVYDAWKTNGQVRMNKCPVVDQWESINIRRVRVVLESEGENAELIFDGTNTDKFNWFNKSRLLSSPWNDIDTEPQNYFSIEGAPEYKRSFYINRNWGGCPNDVGWLAVFDAGPQGTCEFERYPENQLPYIRFSNNGYDANFNGDSFATADRMVIYLDTPGNDVLCSCPAGQVLSKDGTRCDATCTAWGDPHFATFDGKKYEFQGRCRYTLAKDCGNDNIGFTVDVQLGLLNGWYPPVSTVDKVYVVAYGYEITIDQDRVVTVTYPPPLILTVTATPPFNLANGKIQVTLSGKYVRVELTELYVVILYNGKHRVKVTVPSYYQNKMCGLCGNFNGTKNDDFEMLGGNIASDSGEFGNSWETDSNTCSGDRPTGEPPTQGPCDSIYSYPCNVLTDTNGPFAACHGVVDPQIHFESCVFETCAKGGTEGLCANLEAYYDSCTEAGVPSFTWRTSELCPMDCPANSTYSICASGCPATCANPTPRNCYVCHEGCECDPGYLQSGLNCVRPADCGCTSNDGFYYTLGAVWEDNGEECVCHAGNTIVCEEILSALTLVDAGIGHLTVSWTVEGRLPISRYRLRYQPADGSGSYQDLSPAPGPDATSATVQGLYADTDYILTLTSFGVYDQPTGEINGTYTTDSVVVNVVCDQDSMSLSIPRAALPAVNVEDLHLLDPDCGATEDEDEDVFKLETHLQECGTRQETSGDDKFIFSNEVIASQVTYDNGAVRGQPVNLPFRCEFLRQRNVTGGAIMYNIPSPRIQIVDGNNSFTIEMHMFTSEDFLATYESSDFPIQVSPSDRLHFGLSVTSPLDNLELFARYCVSTPTTNPDDSPRVSIIDDGCQVDQTLQKDNGRSNDKSLYYSVAAFTFPNALDPSLVYFHCTMIICFKDDPDSRCKQGCIPPAARRRRAVSDGTEGRVRRESSRDKRADITQGPFQVQSGQEAGTGPAGVPLGTAVGAAGGVAGIMVLLIVAGVLVKKRGDLALGRKKRDDDTVGLDNYAYQSWGKMSQAGIADTKA